ncbi:hypothetical protein Zm00014a_004821 [Zea mays]|uniref:Uncharacterized protein n=1 Tax=Zea mays TaxID=4577 RepID=A0A3L6FYE7_MAIZE|nr:hypothetical protein Zm00014a_004821 [Zea mays]
MMKSERQFTPVNLATELYSSLPSTSATTAASGTDATCSSSLGCFTLFVIARHASIALGCCGSANDGPPRCSCSCLLLLLSHGNQHDVLSGEEPMGVAFLAGNGTAIWATRAATAASNAPVESTSGNRR